MSNENEQQEQHGAKPEQPATWKRVWVACWLMNWLARGHLQLWAVVYVSVVLVMAEIGWRQHFFWVREHGEEATMGV